jgi:hypothetical protein
MIWPEYFDPVSISNPLPAMKTLFLLVCTLVPLIVNADEGPAKESSAPEDVTISFPAWTPTQSDPIIALQDIRITQLETMRGVTRLDYLMDAPNGFKGMLVLVDDSGDQTRVLKASWAGDGKPFKAYFGMVLEDYAKLEPKSFLYWSRFEGGSLEWSSSGSRYGDFPDMRGYTTKTAVSSDNLSGTDRPYYLLWELDAEPVAELKAADDNSGPLRFELRLYPGMAANAFKGMHPTLPE